MPIISPKSKIYFITPDPPPASSELCALVRAAIRAGVGIIQYRAKGISTQRMVRDLEALLELTRPAKVPLVVNDRVDVALAAGADGVHVGADDMPVGLSRRLMGPRAIVGVTCASLPCAQQAARDVASYVAFGPVFASPTKPELNPIGLELIHQSQMRVLLPVCAIGGINASNIAALAEVNPDLVAVVSAISSAPDPYAAARQLVELAQKHLPHRTAG